MPEMKTLNGYEVVDAKAREDIKGLQEAVATIPEMPDLTPYATETYVDNAIDNIVFPETDLSKHALKSEIPTNVSQLQNDSKFITREEVPETDLSEYAKKSEIPDVSNFITSIPKEYITESELEAKQYLTAIPSEYITETELAAMGYATGGYVDAKVANIVIPDLTPYAKKTDIPDISTKADKGHSHAEYLTAHQDVSHLALKSSVPTKLSELVNDKNFISEIPSEYVTDAELANKGYLTEHQSLTNYATKPYVQTIVEEAQPDLTKYAKKTDVPSIAGLATEDYVNEEVADAKAWVTDRGYATETYVDDAISNMEISSTAHLVCRDFDGISYDEITEILAGGSVPVLKRSGGNGTDYYYFNYKTNQSEYVFMSNHPFFSPSVYLFCVPIVKISTSGGLTMYNEQSVTLQMALTVNPDSTPSKTLTSLTINGTDYLVGDVNKQYVDDAIAALRAELTGGNT